MLEHGDESDQISSLANHTTFESQRPGGFNSRIADMQWPHACSERQPKIREKLLVVVVFF